MKKTLCFGFLLLLALFTAKGVASQDPLLGQWQIDGRVLAVIQIADHEARTSMSLPGRPENATYSVTDTGETYIVTIAQGVADAEPRCVEIRIRKVDNKVLFRIRRDQPMSYDKFRTAQGER